VINVLGQDSTLQATANSMTSSSGHGFYLGGDGSQTRGDAYLTVADGGRVEVAQIDVGMRVWDTGRLSGDGTIVGYVQHRGLIAPGLRYQLNEDTLEVETLHGPMSTLTITGPYNMLSDATLAIRIGASGNDRLHIGGAAALAGNLLIDLDEWFVPAENQWFDILTAGELMTTLPGLQNDSLVGNFNGVDLYIRYHEIDGFDGISLYTIPEPSQALIWGIFALGFLGRRRPHGNQPLFPRLRYGHRLFQRPSPGKQFPSNTPS